jgi:uncharacterized membrane protein
MSTQGELGEDKREKGVVRGTVKYPWGTVHEAKVTAGEVSVVSDKAGNYEISLDPGSYDVQAHSPFPGYESTAQKVQISAGEIEVADIYLDFEKATVEGHVYDIGGKPVVGAVLSGVLYGKEMQSVTTDDQGHFRFDKVTPGNRFMRVNARGYVAETKEFTAKKETTTVVEFRLQPAKCKLYGVVTDADGKALQAEILLMKSGIVFQRTSSDLPTGAYEFPVLPGIYEVNVMAGGYLPRGWQGSVSADTKVDFTMVYASQEPPEGFTH